MGLSSTLIYTSELILCCTICVPCATRHTIHSRIAAEHGVIKAKGSCVKLDTPAQKSEYFPLPSLPPPRTFCWSVWWENLHAFKNIFLFVRTDHSHCMSHKAEQHVLFNLKPFVSIYIAHKIHQNY